MQYATLTKTSTELAIHNFNMNFNQLTTCNLNRKLNSSFGLGCNPQPYSERPLNQQRATSTMPNQQSKLKLEQNVYNEVATCNLNNVQPEQKINSSFGLGCNPQP